MGEWGHRICPDCLISEASKLTVDTRSIANLQTRVTRYDLTADEYRELYVFQRGKCFICRKEPRLATDLAIDHDHETGEVRGLLCNLCNPGLGFFKDNPVALKQAAAYLRHPPAEALAKLRNLL